MRSSTCTLVGVVRPCNPVGRRAVDGDRRRREVLGDRACCTTAQAGVLKHTGSHTSCCGARWRSPEQVLRGSWYILFKPASRTRRTCR
jgi:hypothetical protein